jgi:transposase
MKKLTTKKSMTSKRLERQDEFSSYVGVDLGDKHSCLCILDRWGRIAEELRGRTTVKEFEEFFGKQPRSRVAMEAGSQSRWVCEIAKKHGHEVYVANPHKVQYISGGDDKNDPGDAYKLAELSYVRPSMLHAISHRKRQEQVHLEAIRARDLLVRSRADMINAVRGMSKAFAETLVQCSAESFTTKAAGKLPEDLRSATAPLLRVIDQLSEEVAALDQWIEHVARQQYPAYQLLERVNGVGTLTAVTYMLTLGDAGRFQRSRDVGAYLGMRPRQKDSGSSSPQLGITKTGDAYLRKLLVNCAHYMIGKFGADSDLRRFGLRLAARGGKNAKKRAAVAVARKLSVLLHRLWVSGEAYEALRNSQAA